MKTRDEITSSFEDLLAELNKDPEFREEYLRQKLGYDYLLRFIEKKFLEQAIETATDFLTIDELIADYEEHAENDIFAE